MDLGVESAARRRPMAGVAWTALSVLLLWANPVGAPDAWGQTVLSTTVPSTTVLSMEESIARALSQNSRLRAGRFAVSKAKWDKRHARALFFPTLSFNTRLTRIDDRTLAERDFRSYLPPEFAAQAPQTAFKKSYYTWLPPSPCSTARC